MKIENEKLKRFDENKDGYLNFGELQKMAIAEEEMEKVINETGKRKNGKDKNKDPTKSLS
uniref:EF-hand domain-containing protein n=1 Tax=Romanomermis culicivorax TaxID=13658 RepID=A0A915HKZ2_ROMCU